jgi:uncharacterized membrane protein (DUF106 family)
MDTSGKEGSFRGIFIIMIVALAIAAFWESLPIIKNSVSFILDPTAGFLLSWNVLYGMAFLVLIISLFMTLIQKYATDQETIREIKKEQKELQAKMKKLDRTSNEYRDLSMQSFKLAGPMMKLSMRPIIYTAIPLILFFRWFADFFSIVDFRFFGFLNWFWFYLIGTIIFSSILRKILKVV